MRGKRAGAVDVEKEGSPPEDSWQAPIQETAAPSRVETQPEEDPGGPSNPAAREAPRPREELPPVPYFQRHASQDSTTVPSESSHHPEAPLPKRSRAGPGRPSTILEDSEVSETSSVTEPASSSMRPSAEPPSGVPSATAQASAPTATTAPKEVTGTPAAASTY